MKYKKSGQRQSESLLNAYIRDHVKQTDGTQSAFAARTGFNDTRLSKWLSGVAQPSGESLQRLADDMERPVEELQHIAQFTLAEVIEIILQEPAPPKVEPN